MGENLKNLTWRVLVIWCVTKGLTFTPQISLNFPDDASRDDGRRAWCMRGSIAASGQSVANSTLPMAIDNAGWTLWKKEHFHFSVDGNWPSFLALPINSVLFEECTRNGLIKCAMMLLWLLARVSLLTFAGSSSMMLWNVTSDAIF